jgi:hypothetical protein
MRFMAAWALVHETADEGLKAAVARGENADPAHMKDDPDAFVNGLAAAIDREKDRLKASLAEGGVDSGGSQDDLAGKLDELAFEVGELRGRIESLQTSVDALGDEASDIADIAREDEAPGHDE